MASNVFPGVIKMFGKASARLAALHRDERGMEPAMIVMLMALVGIPLVIALTYFGDQILGDLKDATGRLKPNE